MTQFWMLILLALMPCLAHSQEAVFLGSVGGRDYIFSFLDQTMGPPVNPPDIEINEQSGFVNIPLYTDRYTSVSFIGHGKATELNAPLNFTDRGLITPQNFGTIDGGFSWNQQNWMKKKYGASATYGSAGTNLLGKGYTALITASAYIETPNDAGNSWIFFISYSNNRTFLNNIPLPGVAFSVNGDNYKILIGLPFVLVSWRPDPVAFLFSISPFSAVTDLGVRVWGPIQIYSSAAWTPKAYQNLLSDTSGDRLIFDEKEVSGGIRIFLGKQTNLSGGYIYGFARRFFLGQSVFSPTANPIAINDGTGFTTKLQVAF